MTTPGSGDLAWSGGTCGRGRRGLRVAENVDRWRAVAKHEADLLQWEATQKAAHCGAGRVEDVNKLNSKGLQRGVSYRVEEGLRPLALRADTPNMAVRPLQV
jgi:hypothetical protein